MSLGSSLNLVCGSTLLIKFCGLSPVVTNCMHRLTSSMPLMVGTFSRFCLLMLQNPVMIQDQLIESAQGGAGDLAGLFAEISRQLWKYIFFCYFVSSFFWFTSCQISEKERTSSVEAGVEGLLGITGPEGSLGLTGSMGLSGSVGLVGSTGFVGSVGFSGLTIGLIGFSVWCSGWAVWLLFSISLQPSWLGDLTYKQLRGSDGVGLSFSSCDLLSQCCSCSRQCLAFSSSTFSGITGKPLVIDTAQCVFWPEYFNNEAFWQESPNLGFLIKKVLISSGLRMILSAKSFSKISYSLVILVNLLRFHFRSTNSLYLRFPARLISSMLSPSSSLPKKEVRNTQVMLLATVPLAKSVRLSLLSSWRLCSLNSKVESFQGFTLNLTLSRIDRLVHSLLISSIGLTSSTLSLLSRAFPCTNTPSSLFFWISLSLQSLFCTDTTCVYFMYSLLYVSSKTHFPSSWESLSQLSQISPYLYTMTPWGRSVLTETLSLSSWMQTKALIGQELPSMSSYLLGSKWASQSSWWNSFLLITSQPLESVKNSWLLLMAVLMETQQSARWGFSAEWMVSTWKLRVSDLLKVRTVFMSSLFQLTTSMISLFDSKMKASLMLETFQILLGLLPRAYLPLRIWKPLGPKFPSLFKCSQFRGVGSAITFLQDTQQLFSLMLTPIEEPSTWRNWLELKESNLNTFDALLTFLRVIVLRVQRFGYRYNVQGQGRS